MNEPTRTMFGDLAIATGVALAVGVLVACASWPLVKWLEDRRSDKVAGEVERRDDAPQAIGRSLPGVVQGDGDDFLPVAVPSRMPFGGPVEDDDLTVFLDDEIAATARRTIRDQGLIP